MHRATRQHQQMQQHEQPPHEQVDLPQSKLTATTMASKHRGGKTSNKRGSTCTTRGEGPTDHGARHDCKHGATTMITTAPGRAMTNSERAKFYRRRHAEMEQELARSAHALANDVLALYVQRDLLHQSLQVLAPRVRQQIAQEVAQFVETRLDAFTGGLHAPECRHEFVNVLARGDAQAPIVRLHTVVHGKLAMAAWFRIYTFLLGNTIVLGNMLQQELSFPCLHTFFFTAQGALERHEVEIDPWVALAQPLGGLLAVARIAAQAEPGLAAVTTKQA